MKALLSILVICVIFGSAAQKEEIIHHHKFPNGKTSTICVIKDDREGYAKAFNFKGEEIYHRYIRRFAGHASVHFQHHPNGMVKKAEYSSHPDGGIQWYRSYTHFDEQGNITSEIEDNWDTRVTVPTHFRPDSTHFQQPQPVKPVVPNPLSPDINPNPVQPVTVPTPVTVPKPQKQETVACASIHKNKTEFVNHSKHTILLGISHQGKDTIVVLKPGRIYIGPTYISAEIASPLGQNVRFKYSPRKKNIVIEHTHQSKSIAQYETAHVVNFYGKRRKTKQAN
jgi:hypothetical protein